jgi:integrase
MTSTTVRFVLVAKRAYGSGSIRMKHGAWYGSWRTPDGRRTTRKLGPVRKGRDGVTKTQAEGKLREMILADGVAAAARAIETPTVREAGTTLVARLERDNKKRSPIESVESHLRAHINPLLGELRVGDVLDSDVEKLVNRMLREGLAPKTIRNNIGTLHSVMERAAKDQLIERNPVDMAELPRVRKRRGLSFLTVDELDRVVNTPVPNGDEAIAEHFPVGAKYGGAQAVRDWWPVVRLLILTAAMTGMRLGELRGLRWRDLGGKIRVRDNFVRGIFDDPKSEDSSRGIPVAARVMAELDEHHRRTPWNQDDDLVLAHPHTGRPLDKVRLGQHYKAALRRAGVGPVRIHDLRHTFATTVAASGQVSLRTLQEWMGHEDIRTTQIYAHYMPGEHEARLIDDAFAQRGLQLDSKSASLHKS